MGGRLLNIMSPLLAVLLCLVFSCDVLVEGFAIVPISSLPRPPTSPLISSSKTHHTISHSVRTQRTGVILNSAPDGMHWFVKTEQFCKPFPEVKPHLEAHREWVRTCRKENDNSHQTIVSGYRVDENDRPGGGGLMIFAAENYESALEFVKNDPLVANNCVEW